MKPKTNREKVKHIRAFDKEFNVKRSKELDFLLMLAQYTEGPELTPEAWKEIDDLYHHIKDLEEGNQDQEKGAEQADKLDNPRFEYLATHYGKIPLVYEEKREKSLNTLKSYIREHFTATTEPQEPQTDDSLRTCHACGYTKPANTMFRKGGVDYCEGCMNDMT